MPGTKAALLVEEDEATTERLSGWLEREGYWVMTCPGPLPPTYRCPGATGDGCPLAELADVVVLDLQFQSDAVMEGVPGWQLLLHYTSAGKPVVALAGPEDEVGLASEERLVVLSRAPEREELSAAVRSLQYRDTSGKVIDITVEPVADRRTS